MLRARRGGRILVPPGLKKGDLVGVAALGFAPAPDKLREGIAVLQRMGLRVRKGASLVAREGYFAGSDAVRGEDLKALFEDDEVRAILFARGGWGASRILDSLPWARMARSPKILIGYSDLTALFAPLLDRCRLSSVYGPVVSELSNRKSFDRSTLERALFRPAESLTLNFLDSDVLAPGKASGRLAGGCLSLLAHLVGTPYAPVLADKVLLVEEIEEAPYRIDRMLTQLRLAGLLEGVRAILIGSLTGCEARKDSGASPSARDVIVSHFAAASVPIVSGFALGHTEGKLSVPLGFRATVDTHRRRILLEP